MNASTVPARSQNHESVVRPPSGWLMLLITLALVPLSAWLIWSAVRSGVRLGQLASGVGLGVLVAVMTKGFFTLQPNEGAVLILFGAYRGTVRASGFLFTNPFNKRLKISLRSRNLNGEKLKVNEKRGNPIEIAAVVVWRVVDTAKAVFDVDDYSSFVHIQSESAVRHLASSYAYDGHEGMKTLRGSIDEVSRALQAELQSRLAKAGMVVDEARLSHLAYAPEIAGAMLRRQQAEAVVAARMKIVEGAVGMVELALEHLSKSSKVHLDNERKAAMVSNLMVVLCGDQSAQPVVNTGTLYN